MPSALWRHVDNPRVPAVRSASLSCDKANHTILLFMKAIYAVAIAAVCLSSCIKDNLPEPAENGSEICSGTISVSFRTDISTRSSASPEEDALQSLTVMAYRDGMLERYGSSSGGREVTLPLYISEQYDLYAVANIDMEPPVDQRDLEKCRYTITSIGDLDGPMAMAWTRKGVTIDTEVSEMEMDLERLASRISFSVDASLLSGLEVKSVRLRQCALEMEIFPPSGFSRVTGAAQAGDCDMASSQDISDVNSGKAVCFYTLENCQGTLLPENRDPWDKIPDALGEKAGLCTYIEVECSFAPGHVLEGDVTYRFYPGSDNTSNFDIIRNRDLHVTLCPTGDGLKEISWKVETDLGYGEGFVSGSQSDGPYDLTGLYTGVMFGYRVDFSSELIEHLGGDASGCRLLMESGDGGRIEFSPLESIGGGIYTSTGTAFSPGTGRIMIVDGSGTTIQELTSGVRIMLPELIMSPSRQSPAAYDEPETVTINTGDANVYAYLVDGGGRSIVNRGFFSHEPYSFSESLTIQSNYDITKNIWSHISDRNESCSSPYVLSYSLGCENDGSSHAMNLELAQACCDIGSFMFTADEGSFGLTEENSASLCAADVNLEIVDNEWAGYQSSQHTVLVDNPSNLAFELSMIEVFTDDPSEYNAISTQNAIKYIDRYCILNSISYLSGRFYSGERTIYGNIDSFTSERNSYGDTFDEIDGRLAYPLKKVDLSVIHYSTLYFKSNNDRMYILMEGKFLKKDGGKASTRINVTDHLSDGSMKMDIIYGDDPEYGGGYNHQGIWTYYNGRLQQAQDNVMKKYANLDLQKLSGLYDRHIAGRKLTLNFSYDSSNGYMYVSSPSNPEGVSVDIKYSGTVQGYVKTYPKGTWFAAKDNYCSANFSSSTYTVVPGPSRKAIGRHFRDGMDGVYAQTFFDSKNSIGSANNYQHSAHPTSASCTVLVKTSSDGEYYPVEIPAFSLSANFYHGQEGVNYSVPLNGSTGGNYSYVNTVRK